MSTKAVILLSGGPDSSTLAYWAKQEGFDIRALFINTGQAYAEFELSGAKFVAEALGIHLEVADVAGLRNLLIGHVDYPYVAMGGDAETWARGGVFVPVAIGALYTVLTKSQRLLISLLSEDVADWPGIDTFIKNHEVNLQLVAKTKDCKIEFPFITRSKSDILQLGHQLGVPFERTRTCQNTTVLHCGRCHRCEKRHKAFQAAGLADPTRYEVEPGNTIAASGVHAA